MTQRDDVHAALRRFRLAPNDLIVVSCDDVEARVRVALNAAEILARSLPGIGVLALPTWIHVDHCRYEELVSWGHFTRPGPFASKIKESSR